MQPRNLALLAMIVTAALALASACSGGDDPPDQVLTGSGPPTAAATVEPATPSPAPSSAPLTGAFQLPIVMYHDISSSPPDDIYRAASNVLPADFAAQLDYLRCAGYSTITVSRVWDALQGRGALPAKPVVLTFDDGYSNHYTQAFPLLRERDMTGSFAIVTGFVEGGGDYVSWPQIEEMAGAGMEMMSHTVSHIDLGTSADQAIEDQLAASREVLRQHTGTPPVSFVYPSGEPFRSGTPERQAEVVTMLQGAGYEVALLAGPSTTEQDASRPHELNRVRVGNGTDLATFAALVGGPAPEDCAG